MSTKPFIYLIVLSCITVLSTANAAPLGAQTLPPTGQLAISKSGPASVVSQGNITYQLTVSNTGSLTVTGVVITDTLPLSTTLLSTTQNGIELNGVVTWNKLPDLAAGQAITVEMTVKAPFWQFQRERSDRPQRERAPIDPRIVGGIEAEPGAWPWQAAILDAKNPSAYNGQKCSGTLIAPEWVMTAAHCVYQVAFGGRDVLLGQHTLSGSGGQRINGVWWFIHPNFDNSVLDADIALIRLARPAVLNEQVQLIDWVTAADFALDAAGVMATVTGWGNMNSSGGASYPDGLRQVDVPIVTNSACEAGYDQTSGQDNWITENMMCAGYFEGGKDACNGDSGGPLMVQDTVITSSVKWKQVGIVSWGNGCAVVGEPGVYTRISKFAAWVEQIVTADVPPLNTVFNYNYGAKADNGLVVQGTRMVVTKITPSTTQPKLTISKRGATVVQTGGVMTYQLSITNSGSAAATNLVITDAMPSGVTFLAADNGGVLQNGLVQWQVSRLEVSATKTVQFTVQESQVVTRHVSLRRAKQPRIFGGKVAEAGAWPWQVYLEVGAYQCGGVLIDKSWVLTAAHCVYDDNNKLIPFADIQVILGAQNINQFESSQQRLKVTATIPHELYLTNDQDDVALLQLATPATLNDRVQPIALFAGGSQADPGVMATVTGWGMTELGGTSSLLKQVTVPIVSNMSCNSVYQADNITITAGMICAGGQAGQDSCNGDSGGPLVIPTGSNGYLLVGLVSFGGLSRGNPCGDVGVPGVYARVSYYVNWIKANMWEVAPVPAKVIVNAHYGVRADGGWMVKGSQGVTTTIYNGIIVPTNGLTIALNNYITFTSNPQTFNGQMVGLNFTDSLTNIAPMSTSDLKPIGLAYGLAAMDITSQKAMSPTGRYSVTLSYNHLLPLACNLKESSLGLYYYANGVWQLESTSQINQIAKTVSATPNHFSTWAILAKVTKCQVYVPAINNKYCPNAFVYNESILYNMRAIKADQVWADYCFQPGEGIIVAVLDTGVDLTHPDLVANLVTGRNFVEGSGFLPEDDNGHGTNVAGIIAGVANNRNAIGVAPKAKIMPVRVLGEGGGTFAGVAQGIIWAADNGANVINMSLGGTVNNNVLRDAVDYAHDKGVFLVAAAGNCGDGNYVNNGCDFRDQTNYPAAYESVMAVASTNEANEQSGFSNQNGYVEIAAPGSNIYNTYLYKSYRSVSGTSQATPHVAGLAALIWARQPDLSNEEVRALIRNTATDLGGRGRDIQYGYGLINAAAALNLNASARTAVISENPPEPAPLEAINAPFVAGQLLVKLKPGAKLSEVLQQQALQPQSVAETIPQITVQVVNVPVGEEQIYLERLRQSSQVEYVELNYIILLQGQ